jgi:hypothetical protein
MSVRKTNAAAIQKSPKAAPKNAITPAVAGVMLHLG